MLNEFKQYLLGIGKSENTALNYCDKVKLYFKWCLDSFGSEPQQLYRANVLDYISYMKTITHGLQNVVISKPMAIMTDTSNLHGRSWFWQAMKFVINFLLSASESR